MHVHSSDWTCYSGMWAIIWGWLTYPFTFLGITFTLIDMVYFQAIMICFAFAIRNFVFFWRSYNE